MKPITRFLLYCSGTNTHLVSEVPEKYQTSEVIKLSSIGATILLTAVLASFSGGYALFEVFRELPWAVVFGLLWGIVIFTLDRNIIISFRHDDDPLARFYLMLPRILLALLIAVVIARPLEIKIFEDEINQQLASNKSTLIREEIARLEQGLSRDSSALANNIWLYNERVISLDTLEQKLTQEFEDEKEGRRGTGLVGVGERARFLLQRLDDVKKEKVNAILDRNVLDSAFAALILSFPEKRREIRRQVEESVGRDFASSLLAKNKALWELQKQDGSIWLASLLITMLFILIETAPIVVKGVSKKTIYDALLDKYENAEVVEQFKTPFEAREYDKLQELEAALSYQTREDFLRDTQKMEKGILDDVLEMVKANFRKDKEEYPEKYTQYFDDKVEKLFLDFHAENEARNKILSKNLKRKRLINHARSVRAEVEKGNLSVSPGINMQAKIPVSESLANEFADALVGEYKQVKHLIIKFPGDENHMEIDFSIVMFNIRKREVRYPRKAIACTLPEEVDLKSDPFLKIEFKKGVSVFEKRLIWTLNKAFNKMLRSEEMGEVMLLRPDHALLDLRPVLDHYKLTNLAAHVELLHIAPSKGEITVNCTIKS